MDQYNVFYNKTMNIVLALILPSFVIPPFIYLMAHYLPNLPDWVIVPCIFLLLGIVILLSFRLVKSLNKQAMLTLNNDGFVIDFVETNKATPPSFEVKSYEIVKCKPVIKSNNIYMSLETSVAPYTFNICATSREQDDIVNFLTLMRKISEMCGQEAS